MDPICHSPAGLLRFILDVKSLDPVCAGMLESQQLPTSIGFWEYLKVFALTCLLESPFYFGLWLSRHRKTTFGFLMRGTILANSATHPVIYFVFPWFFSLLGAPYWATLCVSEAFAPLLEILLIRKFWQTDWLRTAFWVMSANLFSWWIGAHL